MAVIWAGRAGREREVVERIVALLFSLADLAERAAGRSLAVRWAVLWSLWMAHDIAADFIADWVGDDPSWAPALPDIRRGHDPEDALALALSLRTLALMLGTIAAQTRSLSRWSAAFGGGEGIAVGQMAVAQMAVGQVAALLARLLPDRSVATAGRLDTS